MTFGYDADIIKIWAIGPSGSNGLHGHGKSLAFGVADCRSDPASKRRPLIFVAHSLGGLVCEQALLVCRASNEPRLTTVLESTSGIIFMGTPHKGSDLAAWGSRLAKYLQQIRQVNRNILKTLNVKSEVLLNVEQDFQQLLLKPDHRERIKIFCFYEEIALPIIGKVVPEESAILEQYSNASIHGNHMDMARFSSGMDSGFLAVCGVLKDWINALESMEEGDQVRSGKGQDAKGGSQSSKAQIIASWFSDIKYWLHHKDMTSDLLENSGNWLLGKSEFREWRSSPRSSVLWLHGIPGSGKTKLAAQVINTLVTSLPAGSFAYFYCLRSTAEDERSRPEEVIRSILRQLAFTGTETKVPKEPAVERYSAKEREAKLYFSDEVEKLSWQECVDLLIEILEGSSTVILIDAFDELKKEQRWVLYEAFDKILENLGKGTIRLFISSRDDGDITMKLSQYPNVYIQATDNKGDIERFVVQEVNKAIKYSRLLRGQVSDELKEDIVNTLIRGSQGM
jgi:NACHT domain